MGTLKKFIFGCLFVIILFVGYDYFRYAVWHEKSTLPYKEWGKQIEKFKYEKIVGIKPTQLDVPLIQQMPELPRGCEVTSLAMLLQYKGVKVTKEELAKEIIKDPTPYEEKNGVVYFGNPNRGFVGDIYSFNNPGLGVYHEPIRALAQKYLGDEVIDLTGEDFDVLKRYVFLEKPVWVIINAKFKELPAEEFETWKTADGDINITYQEHSVVITGFDDEYVYVNDPLAYEKNQKHPIKDFIAGWEQMGSQAVSID